MKIRTFGYCVKQGTINLFKNRVMTIASITTISTSIFIICLFFSIVQNIDFMIHEIENKIGIVVFFEEDTEENRIIEIKELIENRDEVYSVTYTSADEAWEEFQKDYFEGREELLEGFENDNPLQDSASLQVFLGDIERQESLVQYITSLNNVRLVREEKELTKVMKGTNELIKYLSVVLIAVLVIVSMFLISNTVRLGIELRKREINIMKYIGATDSLIRLPFVIEGFIIGLIGSIIPLILEYRFYDDIVGFIGEEFNILGNFLVFKSVEEILVTLIPLSIGIGVVIGILGSMMTIHRHLRV